MDPLLARDKVVKWQAAMTKIALMADQRAP